MSNVPGVIANGKAVGFDHAGNNVRGCALLKPSVVVIRAVADRRIWEAELSGDRFQRKDGHVHTA